MLRPNYQIVSKHPNLVDNSGFDDDNNDDDNEVLLSSEAKIIRLRLVLNNESYHIRANNERVARLLCLNTLVSNI